MFIDYILEEIIDLYKDILIVTNKPISFLNSRKICLIKDVKKGLGPWRCIYSHEMGKKNKKDYKWISTFPSDTPFLKKII